MWDAVGRLHPFLVHFPVALILSAFVTEVVAGARRNERLGDAAAVMITIAAWVSILAAVAGFARASTHTVEPELQSIFTVHRIAGVAVPVLMTITVNFTLR